MNRIEYFEEKMVATLTLQATLLIIEINFNEDFTESLIFGGLITLDMFLE